MICRLYGLIYKANLLYPEQSQSPPLTKSRLIVGTVPRYERSRINSEG